MKFAAPFIWAAGLVTLAAAQTAFPAQNNTSDGLLPSDSVINDKSIVLLFDTAKLFTRLHPLTKTAYTQLPHGPAANTGITGSLVLNNADTSKSLQKGDIAYTSCNASDYPGEIRLPQVIKDAIDAQVVAILFFTVHEDYCKIPNFQGYNGYRSLYTMEHRQDAQRLYNDTMRRIYGFRPQDTDTIFEFDAYQRFVDEQPSLSSLGGDGSTAVAMIILYSITGVITALFLIIIVTGAIRAHRHPERYGPRDVLGRPRQSRAKGIARAMLDTIPIVKFGERNPEVDKEVETGGLAGASSGVPLENYPARDYGNSSTDRDEIQTSAGASESGTAASSDVAATSTSKSQSDPANPAEYGTDEGLGCSICTDDFEVGQDIRVLPCNHKFHPACVDPWLLDVSGTCPLCRVDLHPATEEGAGGANSDDLPPPLDPTATTEGEIGANIRRRETIKAFVTSRLNRRGLQGTSREERLEILRRWREANRAQSTTTSEASATAPNSEEDSRRANRLSRFSRVMRRRER